MAQSISITSKNGSRFDIEKISNSDLVELKIVRDNEYQSTILNKDEVEIAILALQRSIKE